MRRSAPPELTDDDAPTLAREPPTQKNESPAMQLLVENRPRDPVGAGRVLANLESKLLKRHTAEPVAARYVLLQEIGAGGIGRVYSAYDPELDRRIAVKFLHAYSADEQASARLLREAQAMAKLSHPNVVAVYDVGMLDRQVFIAMELVDGLPLSRWFRAEKRSWSAVRDVMLEAGKGVVAAHEAGLVHRDFKPANVLVGSDGRVRVLDFGLARRVQAQRDGEGLASASNSTLDARLTATGAIMGTPAYMAPEQILGGDVGPAADQWAFCVALYEGLFGRRPFSGEDTVGLCRAITEGEPAPPPGGQALPSWLVRACMRGLAKQPRDRFASMQALLDALQHDRTRRRRSWAALALVGVLSAGGAAAAATWLAPVPTAAHRDAVEQLAIEARAAAARTYYVYPPPEEPQLRTAYPDRARARGVG